MAAAAANLAGHRDAPPTCSNFTPSPTPVPPTTATRTCAPLQATMEAAACNLHYSFCTIAQHQQIRRTPPARTATTACAPPQFVNANHQAARRIVPPCTRVQQQQPPQHHLLASTQQRPSPPQLRHVPAPHIHGREENANQNSLRLPPTQTCIASSLARRATRIQTAPSAAATRTTMLANPTTTPLSEKKTSHGRAAKLETMEAETLVWKESALCHVSACYWTVQLVNWSTGQSQQSTLVKTAKMVK